MTKNNSFRLMAIVLLVAMLAGCAPQPAAPQPEATEAAEEMVKIEFRLNWTLYGEHAPFFLGVEKGFYKEEGLDVTIVEGSGSATVVKLIGNGTNPIGYADSATMMRGVSAGVPVKAVMVTLQSSPMSFIQRGDHANLITSIDKVPGSSIAITAGDASLAILDACLGKNNISKDQINLIQVANPAAKETSVLEGQADTFLGYFVDQPLRMEKVTGIDMTWNKLVDICQVNTLSSAIVVNNFYAQQNPDVVRKFVRASQRAWAYTLEHPEEAAALFPKYASAFDEALSLDEINGSLTLLHTPNSEGKPIGWAAPEDWTATQDVLAQYAGFKPEEDVNVFFTNEYIAEPPYTP